MTRLQQVAAGEETAGYSEAEAARALRWIGDEHARRVSDTVTDLVSDPSAENRRRFYAAQNAAVDTDYWAAKSTPLPASALAPGG